MALLQNSELSVRVVDGYFLLVGMGLHLTDGVDELNIMYGDSADFPYFEVRYDLDVHLVGAEHHDGKITRSDVPKMYLQVGNFTQSTRTTVMPEGMSLYNQVWNSNVTIQEFDETTDTRTYTGIVLSPRDELSAGPNIRGHSLVGEGFNAYVTVRHLGSDWAGSDTFSVHDTVNLRPWTTVFASPIIIGVDVKSGLPTLHSAMHQSALVLIHELAHTTQFSNYFMTTHISDQTRGGSWEGGAVYLEMHPISNVANSACT